MIILLKKLCLFFALLFAFPFTVYGAQCSAASAVVIDMYTGEILYENNINEQRSMASTTKIMTAYIACESGRLNETVVINDVMVNTIGTSLGLRTGDKITLYDLVVGMLLSSGNDAANATAIFLGGSLEAFAAMMNETAAKIGMWNTLFVTPSGLDEGNHHSTAYDMALLTAAALHNETFAKICAEKSMEVMINGQKQTIYNHNKLLSFMDDCIGVKTGYTEKAGRCLVSAVKRNGHTLVCVTLNDINDWNDHISLYDECFGKFTKMTVADNVYISIVGGKDNQVKSSYQSNVTVLFKDYVNVEIYHFPFLYAPVKKGDEIGRAIIKYKEKEIASVPITADADVEYYVEQQ